jgi:hypothetical protein
VRFYIFLAFTLSFSGPAYAELTSDDILVVLEHGNKEQKVFANGFIQGTVNALDWANSYLGKQGERLIYCLPENLALTPDQEIRILKEGIKKRPGIGKHPAGFALLEALQVVFPCSIE